MITNNWLELHNRALYHIFKRKDLYDEIAEGNEKLREWSRKLVGAIPEFEKAVQEYLKKQHEERQKDRPNMFG